MQHLKCISSAETKWFKEDALYPVVGKGDWNKVLDAATFIVIDETNSKVTVPLKGFVWEFELVEEKPRVPRVRRKRKTPPKKTTTTAQLRYKNGQSFTFRNVKNVSVIGGDLTVITSKTIEKGITQRVMHKIDASLVRSVIMDSPKGTEEIYQDVFVDGSWMYYTPTRTIMNSKMLELRF